MGLSFLIEALVNFKNKYSFEDGHIYLPVVRYES